MIDSVFRTGKNYNPHVFLEDCKYIVNEKKMPEYITEDVEILSDDSNKEDSDGEISNEESSDEENQA